MKRKKSIVAKLTVLTGITILIVLGILISCEEESFSPVSNVQTKESSQIDLASLELPVADFCGTMTGKRLMIDQKETVGSVIFYNDRKFFYAYASVNANYKIKNAYLFAGAKADVPLDEIGDPDLKNFKYKVITQEWSTVRSFRVPLGDLQGKFSVALMLEVLPKSEMYPSVYSRMNAWAEGQIFGANIGRKGMFFPYEKGVCLFVDYESVSEGIEQSKMK